MDREAGCSDAGGETKQTECGMLRRAGLSSSFNFIPLGSPRELFWEREEK